MGQLGWILFCRVFNNLLVTLAFIFFIRSFWMEDVVYSFLTFGIFATVAFSSVFVSFEMEEALVKLEKDEWKTPIPKA